MGYNTVVVLYNDHTDCFAKDGPLGGRIAKAMQAWSYRSRDPSATYFGSGMVVSQDHADYDQVVVVGQNSGRPLSECNDLSWMAIDQLKNALERHGYKVTKRRQARPSSQASFGRTMQEPQK